MAAKAPDEPGSPDSGLSRRQFMGGAAALAAGLALPALPGAAEAREERGSGAPSRRPNLVILMTDQERYPQHWPEGWADRQLPNRRRIARHGLTFRRAFCATSMCSPSRASIFTGVYPAEHGVKQVLQYGAETADQATLQPSRRNMANLLASAGYDVQYRGKWHISKDPSGTLAVQSRRDLEHYGFLGWLPPDAGSDEASPLFGGGDADYDGLCAGQAASFLKRADPLSATPFALIVSLVNPHDVMGYPMTWDDASSSDIPPYQGSDNYGEHVPACFAQGISLPSTWHEILRRNYKPHAQWQSTEMWSLGLEPIRGPQRMHDYVNFYAYLHKRSDRDMGTVLDALEANRGLRDRTIVIRLSDHGEMGLAHGGMREKAYNAYEETIHVPLVISNPTLFPKPVETDALASLVDLMPTLATLADVPHRKKWHFRGRDLTPVIREAIAHPGNPTATVQDSILFTTDETIGSVPDATPLGPIVEQPAHIRCIREAHWKFAMYFDPDHVAASQYELYDLRADPLELSNMAAPESPAYDPLKTAEMQAKLDARMSETGTVPA
jgi:arylsulfatase A-like enzyme